MSDTDFDPAITALAEATDAEFKAALEFTAQKHPEDVLIAAKIDGDHPDFYVFKMALRDEMLAGADTACNEHSMGWVRDSDLPDLFKQIDALASRLFERIRCFDGRVE